MNKYLRSGHIEKIKTLKQWAQLHLPKQLSPLLDYTLGWLSPELLGTGFVIDSMTDYEAVVRIPVSNANINFQQQIHLGLVVNAGQKMITSFLQQHLVGSGFELTKVDLVLKKKLNWGTDLVLKMNVNPELFEQQLIEFHKKKIADFDFVIDLQPGEMKKKDQLSFKIELQKVNLLS